MVDIFQSSRPVWGETRACESYVKLVFISILSPHAGRDWSRVPCRNAHGYFNPLAPCGARLTDGLCKSCYADISIHSPRAGRDSRQSGPTSSTNSYFNPLAPCGARQVIAWKSNRMGRFQSTCLVRARRSLHSLSPLYKRISILSPRAGRDLMFFPLRR